jgi:glyoxylase-like metal-dependent hydrolase (beta-lactamase superfamily II)
MRRWQVGEVAVVRVESVELTLPSDRPLPAWAVPHLVPATDTTAIAFSAFGIVDGDRRIVVDPWLADDAPRSAPDAAARIDGLLDQLAAAGLPADEVDLVVNTHVDGIGWNTRPGSGADGWTPTFPNARYIFPQAELAAVERGEPLLGGSELGQLLDAGVVDPVDLAEDGAPLALSPHVALHAAPGHSFGHVAVHVDGGDDLAVIPGHLFLDLFSVDDPSAMPGDGPEAPATRRHILDQLARRSGLLLSSFFGGDGAGRVAGDATGGYRLTPVTQPESASP